MSYTPTEWATGDIVTAEKLNKLEGGVEQASGGAPFIVHATQTGQNTATVDKTFAEIAEAYETGVVYFNFQGVNAIVTKVVSNDITMYQASYMITMDMSGWLLISASISVSENEVTLTMDMFPLSTS